MRMNLGIWGLSALLFLTHAAPLFSTEKGTPMIQGQPQPAVWFAGSVQAAFEQAQKDKKLVFLYWGAVWCPPCNELKANIFTKARFAELMQNFIPVYLDGDTEQAQSWGEKLQISGYPTVLVLDASQRELFRLSSSVDLAEFERIITPLIAQSQNFADASKRLKEGKSNASDWPLLAYTDWQQLPKSEISPDDKLSLLHLAFTKIPATQTRERSLLASQFVGEASSQAADNEEAKDPGKSAALAKLRPDVEQALDVIFADKASIQAARLFINNNAGSTARWLFPERKDPAYGRLKSKWLAAAGQIAVDDQASIDTRLWAVFPELEFFRLEEKTAPVPVTLKTKVEASVQLADQRAQDPFARHAVISGAAYLLRQVGSHEQARRMLLEEAAKTDTPWYYYGSLAGLETELKRDEEARKWATKARESARGRASKLQWITSDIQLNAKLKNPEQKPYLLTVTREFYELATLESDGFEGRNRSRAEMIRNTLDPYRQDQEFVQVFNQYQKRCEGLKGENQKNCQAHFQSLLSGTAKAFH